MVSTFGGQGQTDMILLTADQNTFLNYSNTVFDYVSTTPMIAFIYYHYLTMKYMKACFLGIPET